MAAASAEACRTSMVLLIVAFYAAAFALLRVLRIAPGADDRRTRGGALNSCTRVTESSALDRHAIKQGETPPRP